MEDYLYLFDKLPIDRDVIKSCNLQLLSFEEITNYKNCSDWKLDLKVNLEYDLAYEKLYIGQWNQVAEESRRMFQVLSFLKAFSVVKKYRDLNKKDMLVSLKALDLAIIIGTGLKEAFVLKEFAQKLHNLLGEIKKKNYSTSI
jgi:hypothetical protein